MNKQEPWENRIDWSAAKLKEAEIKRKRSDLIEEIEDCASELNNAYFGAEFDREALRKSEEFLSTYAGFLRGLN